MTLNENLQHIIFYEVIVYSLSTIAREYLAMWLIGSLPFKDLILSTTKKSLCSDNQGWKFSKFLEEYIKDNHNET